MPMMRLNKAIAHCGFTSRRKADELIFAKKVFVNGKLALHPSMSVDPEVCKITVQQTCLEPEEKVVYLCNKPKNFLCTNVRAHPSKKLLIDLFPPDLRLFTVGRLDRDTTGLILVTNDGDFCQKVIHPSRGVDKEYVIKTKEEISLSHLTIMQKGVSIEGKWIRPKKVQKVRKNTCKIVVREGKKHEVRLLVKKANLSLLSLKRVRIGSLHLGSLPEGSYRTLTTAERNSLFI